MVLPIQVFPTRVEPSSHSHLNEPSVLTQRPKLHGVSPSHSLISSQLFDARLKMNPKESRGILNENIKLTDSYEIPSRNLNKY